MSKINIRYGMAAFASLILLASSPGYAHKLRAAGETVEVAKSRMVVTPDQDWNLLNGRPGKHVEVWTLDGEHLNSITFFGGIGSGEPLIKEHSKKKEPLPKFGNGMLLIEIPELLEGTYRAYKHTGSFDITSADPDNFADSNGIKFTYKYVDDNLFTYFGVAHAAIIKGKLFMISYEAPRIYYFDRHV